MSRSLAFVGILTIIGATGTWSAIGQDNTGQTSTGVVSKNHITDAERDRLMRKAMDEARAELDKQKAATQAQEDQKAEIKRRAAQAETLAAEARRDAEQDKAEQQKAQAANAKNDAADKKEAADKKLAADKKAEEVRLAAKLAEEEKQSSAKATARAEAQPKSEVQDLDKVKAESGGKTTITAVPKEESVATSSKDTKSKSPESKSGGTKSYYSDAPKKEAAPEKTVIETVSTKEPGSGLSVKTTMPKGDDDRKAEQLAARSRSSYSAGDEAAGRASGGESQSLSGRVVGMMRSTDGKPRILLSTEDSRMIQVVMEADEAMPAPGAFVSVKGREIGGGNGRPVISAHSVRITSGEAMQTLRLQPEDRPDTVISEQVSETRFTIPAAPIMIPPMGMMGPPMPMMHGPGPGLGLGMGFGPMGGPHHPF